MEHKVLLPAETLIPHSRRMRLLDGVRNPSQNGLDAEARVTEAWPLAGDGMVSSLICIELVAQAVSALSTWRRGEGARPRIGLLVGIRKAEFFAASIPVDTRLFIRVDALYQVGDYAVFEGAVSSEAGIVCKTIIQGMEPEQDALSQIMTSRGVHPGMEERGE